MIGINGVFSRFMEIVPLIEPSCTKEHHEYKKEIVNDAFDQDELLKVLADEELDLYPRERELVVLNTLYVRRAIVRLLNSHYFEDINFIAPVYSKIRGLENEVAGLKERLEYQDQRLQQLEQGASK